MKKGEEVPGYKVLTLGEKNAYSLSIARCKMTDGANNLFAPALSTTPNEVTKSVK
jgi:hypothetical protein